MDRIDVSHEMLAFVGAGAIAPPDWPDESVMISFVLDAGATCAVGEGFSQRADLRFVVAAPALTRIFGQLPPHGRWHLPAREREIAAAIRDCALAEPARQTYRLAKSIELLCAICGALAERTLVPAATGAALSEQDTRRIVAARRMIDDHWGEPLTLDSIARACGVNRAKLTRGFRALYRCSVAEAIAEARLSAAGRKLRGTDLPVSTIGYDSGYRNNASFARAFGRRFGVSPSAYRSSGVPA